jgi:twitching motility protein PilT
LLKKIGGGRIAAHEIMIGTPAIRNLIREGKIAQMYSAIQTGQNAGMHTLDQNLQELLAKGKISKEEARYRATNKDIF